MDQNQTLLTLLHILGCKKKTSTSSVDVFFYACFLKKVGKRLLIVGGSL